MFTPTHNFKNSTHVEESMQPIADAFYIAHGIKPANIIRYKYAGEGKKMQHLDIDLDIINNNNRTSISEKFRDTDWGDLLIEVYSKYPVELSWMNNNKSRCLMYFFPKRVFKINMPELINFYVNILKTTIPTQYYDEIYNNCKTRLEKKNKNRWHFLQNQHHPSI